MIGPRLGIDLGTSQIRIFREGRGVVLSGPSIVACDAYTDKPVAWGAEAYVMQGKAPISIVIKRPFLNGAISDVMVASGMISAYIEKTLGFGIFKPNVVVCVPAGATGLQKHTLLDVIESAGAGRACLMETPLAAALGAGIDFSEPFGSLIADIGAGVVDAAIVTMGTVALSGCGGCAGNFLTEEIVRYIRENKNIEIGFLTAEEIKRTAGTAAPRKDELCYVYNGKNLITGMPDSFEISTSEAFYAMQPGLVRILEGIYGILDDAPAELTADLTDSGIVLTGGGALLYGLGQYIADRTGIPARLAEEPELAVVKGLGKALADWDVLYEKGYLFRSGSTGVQDSV